jgi:hypothetical protein
MQTMIWFVATVVMWSVVAFVEREMNSYMIHFWAILIAALCTLIMVIAAIKHVTKK